MQQIGAAELELDAKVKEQLLANITKLREERTALIDRFNVVLAALQEKGGEIEEYEMYVAVSKKSSDLLKQFFVKVARKTVMLIGIVVALSMLEINIGPFVAGIGAVGFILAFALQGTLSNFASGLMILMYRPFDVGHVIDTAGVKGIVDSMNLVSTTIKTFDNQIIVVPNGSIWGGIITNVTRSVKERFDAEGISIPFPQQDVHIHQTGNAHVLTAEQTPVLAKAEPTA